MEISQMIINLTVALILGAIMGLERELVGKEEAGIRTSMMVSAGSALFTMIGLALPAYIALDEANLAEVIARNSGFLVLIGNIVVGIGFLGAGVIIKNERQVHGTTTAALIWFTAAIGVLSGLGGNMQLFAIVATFLAFSILYLLRGLNVASKK